MGEPKKYGLILLALDDAGEMRSCEVDASDNLKVALSSAAGSDLLTELALKLKTTDLELVSKALSVGSHGWFDGAWRRNPISLGYSGRVRELFVGTSTGAGSTDALSTPVPAGEIHIVNFCSGYHSEASLRDITYYLNDGVSSYPFAFFSEAIQWEIKLSDTMFILEAGDFLKLRCWSLADTKTFTGSYWGYRIDLDK